MPETPRPHAFMATASPARLALPSRCRTSRAALFRMRMIRGSRELLADSRVHPDLRVPDQLKLPFGFRLRPAGLLDEIANAIPRLVDAIRFPKLAERLAVLFPILSDLVIAHGNGLSTLFGQLLEEERLPQLSPPLIDGRMALPQLFLEGFLRAGLLLDVL